MSAELQEQDHQHALRVQEVFARIVPRYDLMNSLMSWGLDRPWRRRTVALVGPQGALGLDVGTGTGELALELLAQGARRAVGLDFGREMLQAARAKVHREPRRTARRRPGLVGWVEGDALRLPFADETFDVAVAAFTLRNLADLDQGLREIARVLRPGGRFGSLEVFRGGRGVFGALFRLYFGGLVPALGGLVSGVPDSYRYLPGSVDRFVTAEALSQRLQQAGFDPVSQHRLLWDIVAIHLAHRRSEG